MTIHTPATAAGTPAPERDTGPARQLDDRDRGASAPLPGVPEQSCAGPHDGLAGPIRRRGRRPTALPDP